RAMSARKDVTLIQIFCHPRMIREHPRLVTYYRNIAALSQKGVRYLSGIDMKRIEAQGTPEAALTEADAMTLARLFNEHISLIIDSSSHTITSTEVNGLLLVSTGAQIDGAWRNAIGEEAEQVVQRLLVKAARERGILAALVPRFGGPFEVFDPATIDKQLVDIGRFKAFMLTNQTSVVFASEPDISLLNQDGQTVCVIEVKGGADPAGALERYGAAKKSFEATRRSSPAAITILVASCITSQVRTRIEDDTTISTYYNLTELLDETGNTGALATFIRQVFELLGASSAS
ncbi:MAG: XcyI family restriction endonuclease, partial [Ktedonobacterales bacterium]